LLFPLKARRAAGQLRSEPHGSDGGGPNAA
jgi:hypothetical protein